MFLRALKEHNSIAQVDDLSSVVQTPPKEGRGEMDQTERKLQQIDQKLELIDAKLADAREYVARNLNVRGKGFLHFDDWRGNSGHPKWMKNFMIPATTRGRARKAKALRDIEDEAKDKRVSMRRRIYARNRNEEQLS